MKNRKKLPAVATIYGLCMLALGLLYLGYLFFPLLKETAVLDDTHKKNEAQIAVYESYIQKTPELKSNIETLTAECNRALKTYALEGKKIINDIDKGFVSNGIVIDSVSMSDEAEVSPQKLSYDKKPLYSLPISISFKTDKQKLEKLLIYFESDTAGAYYVNSVSVTEQEDKSNSVSLELCAYYFSAQNDVIKSMPKKTSSEVTDETAQQIADDAVNGVKDTVANDVATKVESAAESAASAVSSEVTS